MKITKWFRFGTKTHFLTVPAGDMWIACKSTGEVGTFPGDVDSPCDVSVPSGVDWHPVENESVLKVLGNIPFFNIPFFTSIRKLRS